MGQGRSGYRVLRQMPTRWHDNDIYGHLNNTVHYQLFDTSVNGHPCASHRAARRS